SSATSSRPPKQAKSPSSWRQASHARQPKRCAGALPDRVHPGWIRARVRPPCGSSRRKRAAGLGDAADSRGDRRRPPHPRGRQTRHAGAARSTGPTPEEEEMTAEPLASETAVFLLVADALAATGRRQVITAGTGSELRGVASPSTSSATASG